MSKQVSTADDLLEKAYTYVFEFNFIRLNAYVVPPDLSLVFRLDRGCQFTANERLVFFGKITLN